MTLNAETQKRLSTSQNIWLATVRPDGRPHLVPIWFAWEGGKIYVSTEPDSIKAKNIAANSQVVAALEEGNSPVICEGVARRLEPPWPPEVVAVFRTKYDWDITTETRYSQLYEITPRKWLVW